MAQSNVSPSWFSSFCGLNKCKFLLTCSSEYSLSILWANSSPLLGSKSKIQGCWYVRTNLGYMTYVTAMWLTFDTCTKIAYVTGGIGILFHIEFSNYFGLFWNAVSATQVCFMILVNKLWEKEVRTSFKAKLEWRRLMCSNEWNLFASATHSFSPFRQVHSYPKFAAITLRIFNNCTAPPDSSGTIAMFQ